MSDGWSKKKTVIFILCCGVGPFLLNVSFDGWPDWSAQKWLIYLGGFVVIIVAALATDAVVAARKARAGTPPNGSS